VEYIIGMDGGGTKTHGIISDLDGNPFAEVIGGSANFQMLGVDVVARSILKLILELVQKVGCDFHDVKIIVIGLAGAGKEEDKSKIYNGIVKIANEYNLKLPKLIIETDARIALEGALMGGAGIVLISGTGSVMFAKDVNGEIHRVGGWGRFIGDEGSGFTIGREALRAVAKFLDGRGEKTILKDLIFEKFKITDLREVVSKIYSGEFDLASVAPIVMKAGEMGDEIAIKILDDACYELLTHIKAMLGKSNFGERVKLVLMGGVLRNENYLSRKLKKEITKNFPQIDLIEPMASPAYGAIVYAKNLIKNKFALEK
jgi:N-acetylglucosamine kinase-like BadF-type ATPase